MENKNHSLNSFDSEQGKDKCFNAQMKRVFTAFYGQPKTMLMVSIETGILRANICRYVSMWSNEDQIRVTRKGVCPISKHFAGFYTTDPGLFPKSHSKND